MDQWHLWYTSTSMSLVSIYHTTIYHTDYREPQYLSYVSHEKLKISTANCPVTSILIITVSLVLTSNICFAPVEKMLRNKKQCSECWATFKIKPSRYTQKARKNVSEISLESKKVAGLLQNYFWVIEKQVCFPFGKLSEIEPISMAHHLGFTYYGLVQGHISFQKRTGSVSESFHFPKGKYT
jgi:hypothetical protein